MVIRVVKIGGRAQSDPSLVLGLAAATRDDGARLVLVHGGGDEVTALQRRLGHEPRFVGGRRATTVEELDVVRMVLSGLTNKRLVRQLLDAGVLAVGVSGEDGALVCAEPMDGGALGAVGVPTQVDVRLIETLLGAGYLPVISPLARHAATGEGLNVNGDDAAAAIAVACGAQELLLLADVPGVLDAHGAPIDAIDIDGASRLVATGVANGGMSAKLEAARRALAGGVPAVRIGGIDALRDPSRGTLITPLPSTV
jgi:acetylglutamate kinase